MSESSKAVFLSYASQDAEAAKRIADALRAAGIEVWFDRSELRGGDSWDQKIRRQIKECALFVPVISRNTQSRPEGYFRLEWHLAEQRSLLIAKGRPFLVPACIDDTSEHHALVPDAFLAVQWMKAPAGECSPAFVADMARSLTTDATPRAVGRTAASPVPARPATPRFGKALAAAFGLIALAAIAALFWRPWSRAEKPTALAPPPLSAAANEIAALRARIVPDRWQKGDFEAINATLDRLLKQNPEDADAWALRSIVCSLQTMRLIDRGTKMLQDGRAAAERATSLAPDSPLANLALGYHLTANINRGGDPEAGRGPMERAVAALPPDAITRYGALACVWNAYDLAATEARAREWLVAEPNATFPAWIIASLSNIARRPDDALAWAERVTGDPNITGVRAYSTLFDAHYYLRADLAAAAAVLERVPPRGRTVQRIVFTRWLLLSAQGRHDEALQALAAVPEPFIGDVSYSGPKALLAGFSHRWAGRAEPARLQFNEAERLLRERLGSDLENEEYRLALALVLAALDRGTEARTELALIEPVLKGRAPSLYRGQLFSLATQVHATLGDAAAAAYYLRRIFTEPSNPPHTPASLRFDPRFRALLDAPGIQALFAEFAALDAQPVAAAKSPGDDKSVAVLAFANLSDDKANEYFSDGISEELLNVLAKVPGLKVSARTSAFHFKGSNTPIPEIAKQLGVAYVVEGSVRKSGDKVRITAQLIKAADGFHVWSDTFPRDLKDIFAVQDEIAGLIAKNLSLKIGMSPATESLDAEVLPLYYAALQAWNLRTVEGMDRAEELLNRALKFAPNFARGHAALANVWVIRGELTDTISPFGLRAGPLAQKAQQKVDLALKLDPSSAEAYGALGVLCWDTWRTAEAAVALRRATELNPNYASAHQWLGRVLSSQGYLDEGLASLKRAVEVDPLSQRILDNYGRLLFLADRPRECLEFAERALALQPNALQAQALKAQALFALGETTEALRVARALPNDFSIVTVQKVQVLSGTGHLDEVEQMLPHLTGGNLLAKIGALTALGRKSEALAALDPNWFTANRADVLLFESLLDPIRREPRFLELIHQLGLTESHARARAWRAAHHPASSGAKS